MSARKKLFELGKNFSYTLLSNLISLIISALVVLIIPKFIAVEEYGFWQLYIFYTTYVGFLHFGWNDGIYLREGGKKYSELDKTLYFSQFYLLLFFQILIAVSGSIYTYFFVSDIYKQIVLYATAICMVVVNCRYMLLFLLQATNRIKEYSIITILDRVVYAFLILGLLVGKVYDFKLMIYGDIIGKFLSLIYAIYLCKDIVFLSFSKFSIQLSEIVININVGIKLMTSNIASKLIIGNIRFGIERVWSIAVFGQLSLVLSISGFMMLFVNAVGLVLFPFLRNIKSENLIKFYIYTRNILVLVMTLFLFVYFPVFKILDLWLPQYKDGLRYLAILFPMCLYEGKMSMLVSTYLKVLREEKLLLAINLVTLLVSVVCVYITVYLLKNIDLAVFSIIFLVAFRCILAEIFITRKLRINILLSMFSEVVITTVFILACWFLSFTEAFVCYLISYIIFLLLARNTITDTIKNIRRLSK